MNFNQSQKSIKVAFATSSLPSARFEHTLHSADNAVLRRRILETEQLASTSVVVDRSDAQVVPEEAERELTASIAWEEYEWDAEFHYWNHRLPYFFASLSFTAPDSSILFTALTTQSSEDAYSRPSSSRLRVLS